MPKLILLRIVFLLLTGSLLLALGSCEKFSGSQEIPAYISVDSIYLVTNYEIQGTASQNITDSWIYVDDNLIGAFQMPCKIPVLYKGTHVVKIIPGIKRDGIASTRTNYPFYQPVEYNLNLVEDSLTKLGVIQTSYETTTDFMMIENFDGSSIQFDTTVRSEAPIGSTPSGSPETFEGSHSAIIEMDTAGQFFECTNNKDLTVPSAAVYMEVNFNTNNMIAAGVFLYTSTSITQIPVVYLNHTNGQWRKIYIDLTNALNSTAGVQSFRIFFGGYQEAGVVNARILLDNVKVISRTLAD